MRRCHRHPSRQNDPYLEFSFEKSLRKYENFPRKKIKYDTQTLIKNNNIQLQSMKNFQSIADESQRKQIFKQLPQRQNNQRLISQQQLKLINLAWRHDFELFQNPKEVQKIQVVVKQIQIKEELSQAKQQRSQRQGKHLEVDQELKEKEFEILSQSPNKSQQAEISERQNNEQVQNFQQNLPLHIPSSFGKEQFLQKNKSLVELPKKQKQKQGRLNLTDNISVSLRSINKLKQSGINKKDIIEKFLNRMKFTEQEKIQVLCTLDQFLEFNY